MNFCLASALRAAFQLSAHGAALYPWDWVVVSMACPGAIDMRNRIPTTKHHWIGVEMGGGGACFGTSHRAERRCARHLMMHVGNPLEALPHAVPQFPRVSRASAYLCPL